jgi:hypothetical protein
MRVAIINDTRTTHHYGCMLVMENLCRLLVEFGATVEWTWPVSVDWRKHKGRIKAMPDVDAIIINGEGTIHHNFERRFSQALIDFVVFSSEELKRPCYVLNATLHANNNEAYTALSCARAIYVRDKGSLTELQNQGKLTGCYVPDLTFAANKAHSSDLDKRGGLLVVDSAVKGDNLLLSNFAQTNGLDFRSMVVARPSNARFLRSPRPWVKNVIRWLKTDRHISTQPSSYIADLNRYRGVITGRYHTVTMCLKNRIPFLTLESNTPKIRYLLGDVLGDTSRSVSAEDLSNVTSSGVKPYSPTELEAINAFTSEAEFAIANMISNIIVDIKGGARGDFRY